MLAVDGSPVDLGRDCIPVNIKEGDRALLQQFFDRSPRPNVCAAIMGIVVVVRAQDAQTQLLEGLLETLAYLVNIPCFLAVSAAGRYVGFGAVGVINPNWSVVAALGYKLGQEA